MCFDFEREREKSEQVKKKVQDELREDRDGERKERKSIGDASW